MTRRIIKTLLLVSTALISLGNRVHANPEGGVVQSGNVDILSAGNVLTVTQHSDRAVIDWRSFNIESDESTRFYQPSPSSVALNRVNNADPSHIMGNLSANGNIILVNPNGVFFGPGSRVDVNGLIATTADIGNDDFMSGRMTFNRPGNPGAAIIHRGVITAKDAGLVGLVAPYVENSGIISARLGRIELASGDTFTADFYGDGLIEVAVSDNVKAQSLLNTGLLNAPGGTIRMQAAAGNKMVNSLVVASGEIRAPAVSKRNGKIIIAAAGSNAVRGNVAADKGQKEGISTALVSGALDVSGYGSGETGGSVEITGDHIALTAGATIDASGDLGGGDVKVGGDYLGGGETATARAVYVDPYALILNDAITKGDGGRTIIWSDRTTEFHGSIFARGGAEGGNGGFVETSGKENLLAQGHVDLTAAQGDRGTYLLDPANITIYGDFTPDDVSNKAIWFDASDTASVILTYTNAGTTAGGTINTNTLTTSAGMAGSLVPGARIRLGVPGAPDAAANIGSDTYTVVSVAGTIITTLEPLTTTYIGAAVNRGLVSQWSDKAGASHATQGVAAQRPLWVSGAVVGTPASLRFYNASQSHLNLTPNMNNAAGQYNSGFFTMRWNGVASQMPFGFNSYDLWFGSTAGFGYNTAAGNVYGIPAGPLANSWHQVTANFFNGNNVSNELFIDGNQQTLTAQQGGIGTATVSDSMRISSWVNDTAYTLDGNINELIFLNTKASDLNRVLLEQYQSAKWNIGLLSTNPVTEAAQAMNAATGFGSFTTRYLERLAGAADIILQAGNTITLDLQGDAINLTGGAKANKSLSFITTGGNITTASAGSIITERAGSGGNITFTAGGSGSIQINHALTLDARNGGVVTLNATGGTISAPIGLTTPNGDVNINAASITGIYTGKNAQLDSGAGAINATVSYAGLNIKGASANLSGGYVGSVGPASQAMANLIKVNGGQGPGTATYRYENFNIGYVPSPSSTDILPNTVVMTVQTPFFQISAAPTFGIKESRASPVILNDSDDLLGYTEEILIPDLLDIDEELVEYLGLTLSSPSL